MNKKHSIKIDEPVYRKLDQFRGKRETFSQAIDRLLTLLTRVGELRAILEGGINYEEWQKERVKQLEALSPPKDS